MEANKQCEALKHLQASTANLAHDYLDKWATCSAAIVCTDSDFERVMVHVHEDGTVDQNFWKAFDRFRRNWKYRVDQLKEYGFV